MPIEPHDPEEFENSEGSLVVLIGANPGWFSKGKRALRVASNFLLGQGILQIINVATGFLLVRLLNVEAYAQYGVATAFQSVFTILMDLGFAATIVPLVGDRSQDRAVVGRYVRAARRMRDRTFLLLAPVAAACFLATVHRRHWSWHLQILLLASVLLSLYSGGVVSFFSAPLFMLGRLRDYYVPQVISGSGRLLAYAALALTGGLNAWTAAVFGALNITLNGTLIRRKAMPHLNWPEKDDAATDRELLRYVLPATPAILFSALQSQISLFLMSIFGGTVYIAQVAALGRIGGLFLVLMTFNTVVIEPYIARLPPNRVLRNFTGMILLAVLAMTPLVVIAFRWPGAFLWILGAKYAGLRGVLGWYIVSCCANFVSGLVWVMNRGRKWVFWSGSILEVVLLLLAQIAFLARIGVRNTQQAVMFAVASSGCYVIAHGYVSVRGFVLMKQNQRGEALELPV